MAFSITVLQGVLTMPLPGPSIQVAFLHYDLLYTSQFLCALRGDIMAALILLRLVMRLCLSQRSHTSLSFQFLFCYSLKEQRPPYSNLGHTHNIVLTALGFSKLSTSVSCLEFVLFFFCMNRVGGRSIFCMAEHTQTVVDALGTMVLLFPRVPVLYP